MSAKMEVARRPNWQPLLAGDLAGRAWQAIEAVAADLARRREGEKPMLAAGDAGRALLFAYLAEARGDEDAAEMALDFLERAIGGLRERALGPGLYSGFCGIGWAADHLKGWLLEVEEEDEDPNQVIDAALGTVLDRLRGRGQYDLTDGLTGFGVYVVEARRRAGPRRLADRLVTTLAEWSEEDETGTRWWTGPDLLPAHTRGRYPAGHYDLGMAHGVAGTIGVLSQIHRAGLAQESAARLLRGAVPWLLRQELPLGAVSRFPNWVAPGVEATSSRLAWCYGDVGMAVAILGAAQALGESDWASEAGRIAVSAAERPRTVAGARDAGLCHGAAGLGHLFNRLYEATGDDRLAAAAREWFRTALGMRREGSGCGGFLAWGGEERQGGGWRADRGFLTGSAGIALALLGAVSEREPEWDRALVSNLSPAKLP